MAQMVKLDHIKRENNAYSKLKNKEAKEILELVLSRRMTKQEIADRYKVSYSAIKAIRTGRNWLSVTKGIFERYGIQK